MAKRLVKNEDISDGSKLRVQQMPFRICFDHCLDNGYEIGNMTQQHITELHRFLKETVYKGLTVSQVDGQYLRKQGLSAPSIKYGDYTLIHYGKDRNSFRLFGYYNDDGYFAICRIDGNHQTNKD